MKKTKAQKLLEKRGGAGRPAVIRAGELLKEYGLNEEMGTSINSFLTAQNKIPKIYRDREITLGSQILLWLWLRNRFNEMDKVFARLEKGIKELKPKEKGEFEQIET